MPNLDSPIPEEAGSADTDNGKSFRQLVESSNIADTLNEDLLVAIGHDAKEGYETDKRSRKEWEDSLEDYIKLAKQLREEKSFPWQNASNVKYPLLTTAAMQFAARAYPSLVPSDGKVVKSKIIGKDPDGSKLELANRVSTYMSFQVMHEMDCWEEGMDKLLIMLPVVGMVFKKTYWDPINKRPTSEIVSPKNLIVNYWAKSLEDAERISEEIEMSKRKVKQRQQSGLFLDIELGDPQSKDGQVVDETTPYVLIEQHTYLDLDEDGYQEPYTVTIEKESGKVLRIVARFDDTTIKTDDSGQILEIQPIQYYTKFGFIPNPDGSFYDIGFGSLLGPLNESVNTLINQLVDAGSLNNLQGGFLGKGLRLRMGDTGFRPGEWKAVNATGDDLKKQIVPLPSKEPSNVLFQLMGSLITSGKELASVAEIFTGKMPGQNTPATTTMATIEQGMKVFTAVYKRIYRSLAEEFKKIYQINGTYLNPNTYASIVDVTIGPDDFKNVYDICPGADPTAVSQTEKLLKAQGLLELLPTGMLNPVEVIRRVLEAQEQPNWQELFSDQVQQTGQVPPPAPDPKLLAIQAKQQVDQQKMQMDMEQKQFDMELSARDHELQMQMRAQEHAQKMEHEAQAGQLKAASAAQMANIFSAAERMKSQQQMVQSDQQHQQKLQQSKESAKLQSQNQKSKSGSSSQSPKPSKKA